MARDTAIAHEQGALHTLLAQSLCQHRDGSRLVLGEIARERDARDLPGDLDARDAEDGRTNFRDAWIGEESQIGRRGRAGENAEEKEGLA